jgi:hypothetical protein
MLVYDSALREQQIYPVMLPGQSDDEESAIFPHHY